MLWYVYQRVSHANSVSDVWVLTDSEEVLEEALSWGAKAAMTSEDCPSGTARIASVIDDLKADIIVNVQGDEPLILGSVIDAVATDLDSNDADVSTPIYRITDIGNVTGNTVNKVVRATNGDALYFSRSPIPYVRDAAQSEWLNSTVFWGHVGVYAFRRNVLEEYHLLPEGKLEEVEKLEQLRLLEAGKRIHTVEIDYRPVGVDVPEDLELVKGMLDPADYA